MIAKGASLPSSSCQGWIGVTISCSMVPISFSRTTPIAESSIVITIRIIASTAGT